ncbi:ATPase [Taibaiella soli]|uniref:ATPase n=1 Tax=Taibaiella soli TaxID=1649169 RepID=A0A2W2AQH5_9BACT|nr:ATPase [Taibaiella soli]
MISSFSIAQAQQKDISTEKMRVDGNCEMCKKRIENAAYIGGVKEAVWDEKTHMLTVTYRPSKTSMDDVAKHIAHAGYDNDKVKATEEEYNKLPKCCAYKTATCNH